MLTIRKAISSDCVILHGLVKQLAVHEGVLERVTSTPSDYLRDGFGSRPMWEALLAEQQSSGDAVGFSLFYPSYSTRMGKPGMKVEDLFVVPACRGRGVGIALLAAVARLASERGYHGLDLEVDAANTSARAFYARLGFAHQGGVLPYRLAGSALRALAATDPHALLKQPDA